MDGQISGSVFMCRLCNQFSPNHTLLLNHCSQLHPLQEQHEDIIVALQPLAGVPLETPAEIQVKRKRGRPKGSTNKAHTGHRNARDGSTQSPEDKDQIQYGPKQEDKKSDDNRISELKCNDCHRLFSNKRQIVKHICLKKQYEEEEDDYTGNIFQPSKRKKKSPMPSDGQNVTSKDAKKSIIKVVLTEDESLPGVIQMTPVEKTIDSPEHIHIADKSPNTAVSQDEQADNQSATSVGETKAEQVLSYNNTESVPGKGFQEYSIKQDVCNELPSQLKVFACEICNKIFKFRHSLMSHLRTHTQEKPFKCPHCDYASTIKANLTVHLRKHTGEKFSCQHCAFKCLNPGHLKVHVERVHLKVKQHCSFCLKKYSDVKNLIKHIEKSHNLKDPIIYKSYKQLRLKTRHGLRQLLYHCPTCSRCFKNQAERERHLLVHGPQRPFSCWLCDQARTSLATLAAHVRKHPFLYLCYKCDRKFVSSQRLKSHLTESHPELEQEQAFTECIKNSFYLMNDGENLSVDQENVGKEAGLIMKGSTKLGAESREEVLRTSKESSNDEDEPLKVAAMEATRQEKEGVELQHKYAESESTSEGSAQKLQPQTVLETQKDTSVESLTTKHKFSSADANRQRHTPLSEDAPTDTSNQLADDKTCDNIQETNFNPDTHLPSGLSEVDTQTVQSEKDIQISAFQQVLSSIPKTLLNMEIFQRLRKMYGDLECQYCGKLFWYKVHYNAHVRTHTKEHLHYCSKCNYSSITKSSLKRHQNQIHSGLLLPCSSPGCKYTTPDKYKLQVHQRTHQQEGKVACSICHQSYPEHRLKRHIQISHPETLPVKGQMVKRAEKCPYCESYYLKNSTEFQQHLWAHQGVKPLKCNICDYATRSRYNLKNHMNRHITGKSYTCDLCCKKFKSKVSLKNHRLSHTNQGKKLKCSECDFSSGLKAALCRHMEQHASFKPFHCAHCHYSCNTSGPLKRHYKTKHPGQEYQNVSEGLSDAEHSTQQGTKCPECTYVYGTKWELNRHMKNKHRQKGVECTWEVEETVESQFVPLVQGEELAEEHVAALQDNGTDNILQKIVELSSETHDAIASMVAMAPGTVAVVEQVADEEEVGDHQLMVVNADGDLSGEQVVVVEEGHGLEALTVLTQDDNTHHYIVYVQEQTVEI
ncbi:zinc finger protein ZFAT-like isoform X2 [Corythoichthys intestinalis]|uniref:zinc finger protein ZFAT-like isoform X2 n=1 Tax=Corythoichthys intestinalis TaxID=161448 RepID=UPI0025A6336F|nr:zinc finger protein ZFAT-like isoform X2 [Corythoichthys intestinalis]